MKHTKEIKNEMTNEPNKAGLTKARKKASKKVVNEEKTGYLTVLLTQKLQQTTKESAGRPLCTYCTQLPKKNKKNK